LFTLTTKKVNLKKTGVFGVPSSLCGLNREMMHEELQACLWPSNFATPISNPLFLIITGQVILILTSYACQEINKEG
jgi:hypothetical protein